MSGRDGSTPLILALVRDFAGRARLQSAFQSHAKLRFCATGEHLLRLVRSETARLIIVEPWDDRGTSTALTIATIRSEFPDVRVLAYCRLQPDDCHELPALGRAGATLVVFRELDDKGPALRDVLDETYDSACAASVVERVRSLAPPITRSIAGYCARHASKSLSVEELAFAFGITRRTLVNRLVRAGLPPPSTLITWCRLLRATCDLQGNGMTVKQIAHAHGFGRTTTFRRVLKRHTGLRPSDLKSEESIDIALEGLLATAARTRLRRTA
jgi:AraC-like DNA-binding protein